MKKKGFTLAELLIVVGIVAVLVAIAIPVFNNQLERSRQASDAANIRNQYGQVLTQAITEGTSINGKDKFGIIKLSRKHGEWKDNNLKSNLYSIFSSIDGSPSPNGNAYVEYNYTNNSVVLHYDSDSSSDNTNNNTFVNKLETSSKQWPKKGTDATISKGQVYKYNGYYYVATSKANFNQYHSPEIDEVTWLMIKVNETMLDENSKDTSGNLLDLKVGDIYNDNGTYYIRKSDSSHGLEPSKDSGNWVKIEL